LQITLQVTKEVLFSDKETSGHSKLLMLTCHKFPENWLLKNLTAGDLGSLWLEPCSAQNLSLSH